VAQIPAHVTESVPFGNAAIGQGLDGGYMPNPWASRDYSCHINDLNEFQNL
jgi:hypothetical protein